MSRLVIAGLENIALELGCSKKTLYKWIQDKRFPAFKMDGVWRVLPGDVEQWLMARRAESDRRCRFAPPVSLSQAVP